MISGLFVVVLLSATAIPTTRTTTPELLLPEPEEVVGAQQQQHRRLSEQPFAPPNNSHDTTKGAGAVLEVGATAISSVGTHEGAHDEERRRETASTALKGKLGADENDHERDQRLHNAADGSQKKAKEKENLVEYFVSQEVNVTTRRIVREAGAVSDAGVANGSEVGAELHQRVVETVEVMVGPFGKGGARFVGDAGKLTGVGGAEPAEGEATATKTHNGTSNRPTRSSQLPAQSGAGSGATIYTNQFVIQVKGGEQEARKLAERHGFVYLNHILGDYYHLEHKRLAKRSLSEYDLQEYEQQSSIQDEPQVLKLERQVLKRRVKRDFLDLPAPPPSSRLDPQHIQQHLTQLQHQIQRQQQPQRTNEVHHYPPSHSYQPNNGQPQQQQFSNQFNHPVANRQHYQITRPPNQAPNVSRLPSSSNPRLELEYNQASRIGLAPLQPLDPLETASSSASSSNSSPQQLLLQTQLAASNRHASGAGSSNGAANTSLTGAPFNDPSWPLMWYLDGGAKNGFDLNVQAAWKMGFTGKGIVITILDDGLEKDHPDLQANYDPLASFDINGDDADPMPRYDVNDSNRHGTRCAGEVAAAPDNNICSVGIAYNSKVGGVRMLDGDVTDAVEARSLGLNNQHIHIYSASWGPDDNGKTVDGPGELARRAFIEGVTNGRQGLGSIFVFASGNGGREHDNCNCDGYTNSIWTLSISSATENGLVPWYIEACSSTLATTYSSGSYDERQIATTDLHHTCTSNHTGTSASAPLAAGICALVLESNPRLTWRDMQHIVVKTAKPANLIAKDWRTNAMGRNVSHAFGYGLMDAAAMINMAQRWTTMPTQYTCQVNAPQMERSIPAKGSIELKLRALCANIRYLEHVQSQITLSASRRGDLHIYLTSPGKTRSTLLAQRPNDGAEQGFRNWPFMTVHSWGESPNGVWTLEVHNDGKPQNRAYLKEWTLILYGTNEDPNEHLNAHSMGNIQPTGAPPAPPHDQNPNQQHHRLFGGHSGPAPMTPATVAPPTKPATAPPPPISSTLGVNTAQPPLSPHWSIQAPVPGPINSIIQQTSTPASTSTVTSSTTSSSTSATYVTTFKSESGRPAADQQQRGGAQSVKADFETVSPSQHSPVPPSTTATTTQQPASGLPSGTRIWPDTMTPGNNQQQSGDGFQSGRPASSDKLDTTTVGGIGLTGFKQPVGQVDGQHANGGHHDAGLDINQLDLKQTKDYRSSGGQQSDLANSPYHLSSSISATTAATVPSGINGLASNELGGSARARQGSGGSASALSGGHSIITILLSLLSTLAIFTNNRAGI